jgi:hypothetical protein
VGTSAGGYVSYSRKLRSKYNERDSSYDRLPTTRTNKLIPFREIIVVNYGLRNTETLPGPKAKL